jgi:hypothetical protein
MDKKYQDRCATNPVCRHTLCTGLILLASLLEYGMHLQASCWISRSPEH